MSGIEGTFGSSPAAKTLAKILSTDTRTFGRVGKHLSTFSMTLNELSKIDSRVRLGLAMMVFKRFKEIADTYPDYCKSYISNVISMKYKVWLIENDSQAPYKNRKECQQ